MAEEIQVIYDHLIAHSVFSAFILFLTIVGLRNRTALATLRLLSVIPYTISAASAARLYVAIRNRHYPRDFQLYLDRLNASYGILAIVVSRYSRAVLQKQRVRIHLTVTGRVLGCLDISHVDSPGMHQAKGTRKRENKEQPLPLRSYYRSYGGGFSDSWGCRQ